MIYMTYEEALDWYKKTTPGSAHSITDYGIGSARSAFRAMQREAVARDEQIGHLKKKLDEYRTFIRRKRLTSLFSAWVADYRKEYHAEPSGISDIMKSSPGLMMIDEKAGVE